MTSNALATERRWGTARRGGMTVLGKVAVPKPLNLPSQRLENHGLDPNVEIVPKGTLSWGTHSSSSATNAWGSSSADGKPNSPSNISGRPSSGGSGTRPSTAGSDRVNETSGGAWGPNSRPSSASGILSSDQSSLTSLRPHSAEQRPSSSHLSRFAEPAPGSQGTWGASGTSDGMGMNSSKAEDFSLSSGDFPTLGSEKDQPSNNIESKDPGSRNARSPASGREAPVKDEMNVAFDRLERDGFESVGEGLHPCMEKWQAEHQPYFNPNIPPQHFDAWRGPPMNAPPGVWYRSPQGGPPFRPPVGPGGFPMEPFPYYPTQVPPPAFANSQPVPPPRGGPRGHHPESGNPHRPQMHDAFMHPGRPYRPGFYPPPMAFDGYYGPPRGYCNPNESDIPFMNHGVNHPVYDGRYSAPNAPCPSDSHARAGGPGPAGKMSDDGHFIHSGHTRMPVKFLSKQQGEWDGKEQFESREHMSPAVAAHPVMAEKTVVKPQKYEWGAEDDGDDAIYSSAHFGGGGNYIPETVPTKASQTCRTKKLEGLSTAPLLSSPKDLESPFPSTVKAATLMRREGLNAKVHSSDGRTDCSYSGEEQSCASDAAIAKVDPRESAASMSRRPYHGMTNRSDYGGKGKFGNQPADGWQRRPLAAETPVLMSASEVESDNNLLESGFQQDLEVAEMHQPLKDKGGFNTKFQDQIGSQAQRVKMREITKQRAMQLLKEEEERIRDQKAKALAKLEELNRRTQSGDALNPVPVKSLSSEICEEQQEDVGYKESVIKVDSPRLVIQLKTEGALVNDENKKLVVGSSVTSKVLSDETSEVHDPAGTLPLKQDVVNVSIRDGKPSPELDEKFVRQNKFTSYKQKQNNTAVKNYNKNSASIDSREGRRARTDTFVKDHEPGVASTEACLSNQPHLINISNNVSQSSVEQVASRSSTSKNKQDDAPLVSTVVVTGPTQTIPPKTTQKILMPQAPLQLSFGTIQVDVNGESGLEMPDQPSSLPSEDTHGKVNSHMEPQYTRRMPRSQQVNNKLHTNDATVWAPVRSRNKVDIPEKATAKGDPKQEHEPVTSDKRDHLVQSSIRGKRAEMERYIPKPVAKDLAEHVGIQPVLSSVGTSTLNDTSSVQPVGSATDGSGSSLESIQEVVKHNKPGKTHGAWRQRGSMENSHAKNIRQMPSSDPSKGSLKDVSLNQSNPESHQLQAVTKMSERNGSKSKFSLLSSDVPAPEVHHVPKETLITGKGEHYSYGGHKKSSNFQNNANRYISIAMSDKSHVQPPYRGTNQSERAITPKENHATSERASSHWQPKASADSVSSQKGSNITGNQGGGGEVTKVNRKDYALQQRGKTSPRHNESNKIDGSHSELEPESKAEGNHAHGKGRKLTSLKSLSQNRVDEVESGVPDSIDAQHVHRSRKNLNQVNRSSRGHESHGDLSVQGNRQHDRPRDMHYEYQPVGSLDYKKNNFEVQGDGIRNAGSRNRGRGHSHLRRGGGNFRSHEVNISS